MDDQIVWRLVYFHLLICCHVVLAPATVPHVIPRQRLLHHEVIQTVVDRDRVGVAHLEASGLILFYHRGSLNQLNISLGLVTPVGNQDQISIL